MGLLAAQGLVLAIWAAAGARSTIARAAAGGSVALLLPCLYLSLGRGPWLALGVGLLTAGALAPRREELWKSALALVPLPLLATLAVALLPSEDGATGGSQMLRFVVSAVVCAAAAANAVLATRSREVVERLRLNGRRLVIAGAFLGTVALVATASSHTLTVGGAQSRFGGEFRELFTLSGHLRESYWSAALQGYADHPLLGNGAGTFEQLWLLYRPSRIYNVLDAHNAYLEVLAELGPLGLVLFATAVALPLVAAVRAARTPLVAGAAGAYCAYAAHIAIDWDWELPAVTVSSLLCASYLVAAPSDDRIELRLGARVAGFAGACAIGAASLAGLVANGAVWEATGALRRGDLGRARSEALKAKRWGLWSVEPTQLLGEIELAAGNRRRAATLAREALRREPNRYWLWVALARATAGPEQHLALARAHALNPRELPPRI
jgi:hypothetical protein